MTKHSKDLYKSNTYNYTPSVMSKLSFLPQSKPESQSMRKINGNTVDLIPLLLQAFDLAAGFI